MLRKTRNNIWLHGLGQSGSYTIYTLNGRTVKAGTFDMTNGEPAIISTINFSAGMYMIEYCSCSDDTQYLFFNHHK